MTEMGLPRTGASDGPAGMARGKGVTALPTPLSVAANFDPAMATRFGHLLKKADIERQIASTEAKQARVRELARQGKALEDIKAPLGEAPATERPPGAAGRGMRLPTLVDVVYSEITAK